MNNDVIDKKDIVYILKEKIDSEELRYSLRSVCENFNFNKIWFYCGCPKDIKPDEYVPFKQIGYNKLDRVHSTLQAICANEKITKEFYLFNDDFFIMQPYEQDIPLCNGSLAYVAYLIESINHKESFYTQYLKYTAKLLKERGYDTLSYACHVPLLINREDGLQTLKDFPNNTLFRSIYGNYQKIGGKIIEDVKIVSLTETPPQNCILVSTNETSFANGLVGNYIRERFPNPCKYEKEYKKLTIKTTIPEPKEAIEKIIQEAEQTNKYSTDKTVSSWENIWHKIYTKIIQIKKDYFTFPYEE